MSNQPSKRWYAVRTEADAEAATADRLTAAGFEAYCPTVKRQRVSPDGDPTQVQFPMFPGYAFVYARPQELAEVERVLGVSEVVRHGGRPSPLRFTEIEAVRRLEAGIDESGHEPHPSDFLAPGDEVMVVDGPFEGMTGVLLEARGGGARCREAKGDSPSCLGRT